MSDTTKVRNQIFNILSNDARECTKCNLCNDPGTSVFGEGNPEAHIMFVGESPGEEESKSGRPFVGRAGKLLDNMISSIGLTREDVYIANVIKHRPPNNRNPKPYEIEACLPYLKMQIEIIEPIILVVLGSVAMNALLAPGQGITKRCGKREEYKYMSRYGSFSITAIPVFHPSALLRNPKWKEPAWYAMQEVRKVYDEWIEFFGPIKEYNNDKNTTTSIRIS